MKTAMRRLRSRKGRPTYLLRPQATTLEDRLLLAAGDVLTYHNSVTTLPGVNTAETTLTPSNVNPTNFGKLFDNPTFVGSLSQTIV